MSSPTPVELLDLKMLPAWANEPATANDYAHFEGEDPQSFDRFDRGGPRNRDRPRRPPQSRDQKDRREARAPRPEFRREAAPMDLPKVAVRFIPHPPAFESVVAQIKSGHLAYSVFSLARLFLEKPERYDVQLTTEDDREIYQLGDNGPVATDSKILENNAFFNAKNDFYNVEVSQTEPLKGNFSNVARERTTGTLLGPTNHHGYQPALRNLYEQRFSRRMSFADFQRQIEIVSDPTVVEQWKEEARSITTFTTKSEEAPEKFSSASEAERHFRQHHLPTLLRAAKEFTVSGVLSRRLPDRSLGRLIEDSWAQEIRSPSKMMQELSSGLRQAGLQIFRHRRGMLYVSPVRTRAFSHESAGVSASVNAILEKITATPGINRKTLADQTMPEGAEAADLDRAKIGLASDLRWLISEGYVIEFNDGALDLPRVKIAPAAVEEKVRPTPSVENLPNEQPTTVSSAEAEVPAEMVETPPESPSA